LRTLVPAVVAAALVAGCGGAARSGQAGSDAAPAAVAGPAAAFAPPESLYYIHADTGTSRWQEMAPLRASIAKIENFQGGFETLATLLSGNLLEPFIEEAGSAFLGESAFVIVSNEAGAEPSSERVLRYLVYETITDRPAAEHWLERDLRPTGEDGAYKLYANNKQRWVAAVSDQIMLIAASDADLHDAITRAADGGSSLADDPDFRAALARDHDADAAVTGYSRGDLAAALSLNEGVGLPGMTSGLGLTKTAFSAGPSDKGVWVHAHPAATPDGYPAATPFEPSLFKRVPAGALVYVGLSDMGGQLPQLAGLFDHVGPWPLDERMKSDGLPGWLTKQSGVTVDQMRLFLKGEQAWWWGGTTGVAFRPDDTDSAFAVLQQASRYNGGVSGYGSDDTKASRDGDVVSLTSRYLDPNEPPPENPDATLADEPGFGDFLHDSGLPDKVSLLVYGDPRPLHSSTPENGEREKSVIGVFDRFLLWTTPAEGGYDLALYAELSPRTK
jgi:hypothetical protein